jgi:hypothetical protein
MSQIRRVTLAAFCLVLIVASLLIGIQLSNYLGQKVRTETATVDLTPTSILTQTYTVTINFTSTTTSMVFGPSNVKIIGQISSINWSPLAIQFENYTCLSFGRYAPSGCIFSANLTFFGGTVSTNQTYYWATGFSAIIPNNQNYSVSLINENNVSAWSGHLPLFSDTAEIGDFSIQCASTNPITCQYSL